MFVYFLLTAVQMYCPLTDMTQLEMFVPRNEVWQWERQAEKHFEFCSQQRDMRLSPWHPWNEVAAESGKTLTAWQMLSNAYSWQDVGYLNELRLILGEDAYWSGRMPVPQTWHEGWIP